MANVDGLEAKRDLSSFRRIAIGTWATAYDPSVYGTVKLRMDEATRYVEAFRAKTGKRLTVTHMMARAVAAVLADMPDANAMLRFNRIYLRKHTRIFFQVAMQDEATGEIDLSGATMDDAEKKTLLEIVDDFDAKVRRVRTGADESLEATRSTFKKIPFALLNVVLKIVDFLVHTLNLDLRWAGLPKDAFGSVMITNIGSLGLEEAYVPLVPYSRVPLLLALGAVKDEVLVEGGAMVIGKTMNVCATFDHRVLDGSHCARMAKTLRAWMERPFEHFDRLE